MKSAEIIIFEEVRKSKTKAKARIFFWTEKYH